MKKFAVILSGCGVYDGSEIHESTLTLYALSKNEIAYQCFAPNKDQFHVINHISGDEMNEKRNVLIESARIARGDIKDLKEFRVEDFCGIILPGGFGAAKNLSTFAFDGADMSVDSEVEKLIRDVHAAGKPIGALCIAPVIIAKVLGAEVTIGTDDGTAAAIKALGGIHSNKLYNEVAIDIKNKVVSTPCYMLADNIYQVGVGIEAAVQSLAGLCR
jgi:enhancing lycopene biosynthesis protein 2